MNTPSIKNLPNIREELVKKHHQLYDIFNENVSSILEEQLTETEKCDFEVILICAVALARVAFKLLMLGAKNEKEAISVAQIAYIIEKEAFAIAAKKLSTEEIQQTKVAKKSSNLN